MKSCYHLERAGESRFRVVGEYHCGPTSAVEPDGCIPMRWTVRMTCGRGTLDERGFMVDQVALAAWMDQYAARAHSGSCELVAEDLCHAIRAWALSENPNIDVERIHVELRSAPYRGAISHEITYQESP